MSDLIGYAVLISLGGWFRYGLNLSAASADISRALAGGADEPGLQDAITPPLLALGYYACFVATIVAYFGLPIYRDWSSPTIMIALFLGGAGASPRLVPGVDSPYWVRTMHRSLLSRSERYARHGRTARADAMKELAERLERTYPNALQSVEVSPTR
jgi:hypothetical protein